MSRLPFRWSLSELLPELGCLDTIEVTGLTQDSRQVSPGDLFIARKSLGASALNLNYAKQAIEGGAVAVLVEADAAEAKRLVSELNVPVVSWATHRLTLGVVADRFYHSPSRKLKVIGITGTNGKTTSAHFCTQALNKMGVNAAMIGTLGNGFLNALEDSTHTTPDAVNLHRLMAEFHSAGAQAVVMEVSSHSIDQGRIDGIDFDVVAYTNLTRDHLDYHATELAYAETKARLFNDYHVGRQVLNADDPRPAYLLQKNVHGVDRLGFSLIDQSQVVALIRRELTPEGMELEIKVGAHHISLSLNLLGEFNIANLLLVAGVLHQLGYSAEQLNSGLASLEPVAGRMQRLECLSGPSVLVDYAHTPDALEKALSACRSHLKNGRLLVLFGCGGDRDTGKRPLMAQVAERGADAVWLTSDNPRSEDPQQIAIQVMQGFDSPKQVHLELNRRVAIEQIINSAQAGDLVLLAGKGHETYQEINGEREPFCDIEVAYSVLRVGGYL